MRRMRHADQALAVLHAMQPQVSTQAGRKARHHTESKAMQDIRTQDAMLAHVVDIRDRMEARLEALGRKHDYKCERLLGMARCLCAYSDGAYYGSGKRSE